MKIRLTVDVAVDTKEHAQLIYTAVKDKIDWFEQMNNETDAYILFCKCFHDETPFKPCLPLEEWRNGEVTWHNGEPVG